MAFVDYRTWVTGELVGASHFNQDVRDNGKELWRELAYVPFTAAVGLGSEAAPSDLATSGSITYAARPTKIEFFAPGCDNGAGGTVFVSLWDGATNLGRLAHFVGGGQNNLSAPLKGEQRLTPTAAAHEYKARAWGTGSSVIAGAGGASGVYVPGFIRVLQRNS